MQDCELSKLNPSSVNTVRVYTMIDSGGHPHVLTASLRVGGRDSEVDNYSAGGVAYPIDPETGVIFAPGIDMMGDRYLFHPGTNAKVIGFQIPRWKELISFTFDACKVLPAVRLIAWDVAVLENGFEMIEGNHDGNLDLMQSPSGKGQLSIIQKMV